LISLQELCLHVKRIAYLGLLYLLSKYVSLIQKIDRLEINRSRVKL